jgi:hypothetical protein
MKVKLDQLGLAVAQWREIAERNGWGDQYTIADLTVWVDDDGNVTDSVATNTGGGTLYVQAEQEKGTEDDYATP